MQLCKHMRAHACMRMYVLYTVKDNDVFSKQLAAYVNGYASNAHALEERNPPPQNQHAKPRVVHSTSTASVRAHLGKIYRGENKETTQAHGAPTQNIYS